MPIVVRRAHSIRPLFDVRDLLATGEAVESAFLTARIILEKQGRSRQGGKQGVQVKDAS